MPAREVSNAVAIPASSGTAGHARTLGGRRPQLTYALEDGLHPKTLAESPGEKTAPAQAYRRAALPWNGRSTSRPARTGGIAAGT